MAKKIFFQFFFWFFKLRYRNEFLLFFNASKCVGKLRYYISHLCKKKVAQLLFVCFPRKNRKKYGISISSKCCHLGNRQTEVEKLQFFMQSRLWPFSYKSLPSDFFYDAYSLNTSRVREISFSLTFRGKKTPSFK